MTFLLSGEGPTDIGVCTSVADVCEGADFQPGPMAVLIDQIVEGHWGYSILDTGAVRFVSGHQLAARARELKTVKKSLKLPGAKAPKETRYFFNNARLLARVARELEHAEECPVIAVLFRDADGTASAGRGVWAEKRQSMLDGFRKEDFPRGVPMIPKPKSEAWLICALKDDPYLDCDPLEARSGSDHSPHPLKGDLATILGGPATRELLEVAFAERGVSAARITMPSFRAFVESLEAAMGMPRPPHRPGSP